MSSSRGGPDFGRRGRRWSSGRYAPIAASTIAIPSPNERDRVKGAYAASRSRRPQAIFVATAMIGSWEFTPSEVGSTDPSAT